ncbi:hypothetical protein PIROE2DRAFT_9454 [Piromyces sp. E2]|nr:hypothetical protein PIROE2DRAFT_9454 [Piromyces sp. E2]|eukprot:OUM63923.1 hypothetical protein PIROE2DRAFT_9454 [Piromyces sp. E2]
MTSGEALFSRFWNVELGDGFYKSNLPGKKKGISASIVGGYNIIINNGSSESKKKAAGKIIDFLLSKDIQLKYFFDHNKFSALNEVYDDEELCSIIDCKLFKKMQYVSRPITYSDDYEKYSANFREYFNKFLRGELTAKETLIKIDNIVRIYSIDRKITEFKCYSLTFVVFLDILIAFIFYSSSTYNVIEIDIKDGENYEKCEFTSSWSKTLYVLLFLYRGFICLIISLISFIEWNLNSVRTDIRVITVIIYSNILFVFSIAVAENINLLNYKMHIAIKSTIIFLFTLVNYSLIIWYKMYYEISEKKNRKYYNKNNRSSNENNKSIKVSNLSSNYNNTNESNTKFDNS